MKNLIIINNPLVKHYLTIIRDKKTTCHDFREGVEKLSLILAYELSRNLETASKNIETPLTKFKGKEIKEELVLIPVLRAGLGMLSGFLELFPKAKVGHIGVFRNEDTLEPVNYYFKCPPVNLKKKATVFILDPMLATGGSLVHSVNELHKYGMKKILVASLVSAPEGLKKVLNKFKDIKVYTCAVDKKLNNKGYIVPGLGDAGDRMFGT